MLVILESPYAGNIERNVIYARRAMNHSIRLGESPIASHLLYTQAGVLRDDIPEERDLGLRLGYAWHEVAEMMAVYYDYGISPGMTAALQIWRPTFKPVAYRLIGKQEV